MSLMFGPDLRAAYLRSIEAGANAVPSNAVAGLAVACEISFESASMLVAAVRMLDERVSKQIDKRRPYDIARISEQASQLRRLWPRAVALLDWLEKQLAKLREEKGDQKVVISEIRKSARQQVGVLDDILRTHPAVAEIAAARRDYDLSPIVEDAVDQFLRKLALLPPQLTREQYYEWEKSNHPRIKKAWAVVSKDTDILKSADTTDWSFLSNRHRPHLRILVPGSEKEAKRIEVAFTEKIRQRLTRKNAARSPELTVNVDSYGRQRAAVEQLLWFDQTTRTIAAMPVASDAANVDLTRYVRLSNCWIYELERADGVRASTTVGMLDNYSEEDPRFFCVALSSDDIKRWLDVFEAIA